MLQKTQAMQSLQEGCSRLGLPSSTAAALLQFLSVKRTHDQFVPEKDRQLRMSPGSSLDKLWHYMLLNTSVSSQVHALLGGVVEHRGIDAWELADDTKLLQRLYALNIMRLEGHQPDVALWTEAGTAMHTLHLTTSPVAGLQSLPGDGLLYITPSLNKQQQGQLVGALQALYVQEQQPSIRTGQPKPAAAAAAAAAAAVAVVVAAAAAGSHRQPAAKRPRVEQPQQEQQPQQQEQQPRKHAAILNIRVIDDLGSAVHFKVTDNVRLGKVFAAYANLKSLELHAVRFLYDWRRITDCDTPHTLGMEDGAVILSYMKQTGC